MGIQICIRKVLGASFQTIFQLLTINFLKLVVVSLVMAIPIGWLMVQNWLQDYEYRIEMHWSVSAAAGAIVVVSVLTVSFESIKAAVINLANGLRTE
ncbi:FtsX-like permease family protein [Reichenbachiella sp. MALMAid0571]|uniref:ABC transporter permease n=1 Tax=Reichenbachiella sp. MALMAid0571 TaxID=3143939 RepID=UPI0032DF6321